MPDRIATQHGLTFTELLVVLALAALIVGFAVPGFRGMLLDGRRAAAVTTALHAMHFARQLAAIRGETMRLCGSRDESRCSDRMDWSWGLLVIDEAGRPLRSLRPASASRPPDIRSNRSAIQFEAGSGFATPATLIVCDRRGAGAARAIIVSRSGRPRVSERDAGGGPLTC